MLYTSLNFGIYVTDFDPVSYRLESTMLLFRNNTPVPLFLFRLRNAQQSHHKHDLFLSIAQFWTCRWAVQKLACFVTSVKKKRE